MAIIERSNVILGGPNGGYSTAGAPSAGTNAVQTVTITGTPTGGSIRLTYEGRTTGAIAYNASAADVQAALIALDVFASGDVVGSGGPFPDSAVVLTFGGNYAKQPVSAITASSSLTGGTSPAVSVAQTTAGVAASGRGAPKGARLTDYSNGIEYINTGTALSPTWTKIGTQT